MIPGMAAPLHGPVTLNIPFVPESAGFVRQALETWLGQCGTTPEVVADARLVATELVSNAIRHASPLSNGTMLVRWHQEDASLALSVCDGGGPTDPQPVDGTPYDVDGRGLRIVDELCARWWVERSSRLHTVHVRLPLD
jgi:anti-sigma regulatory factor (Ser/Thr protein kinase)